MSRVTYEVTIYGDSLDLCGAISDTSATVHSYHVVYPNPTRVFSEAIHDEFGVALGYRWKVEAVGGEQELIEFYERLAHYADKNGNEVTIGVEGENSVLSYCAGDRQHFLEQRAMRGYVD